MRVRVLTIALAAAVLLVVTSDARAQGFISPFIGYDYGGDSGCPAVSNCEDKRSNIGVAFGRLGGVGFETEFAYARHFFGETPGTSSNVLTFMSNLLIAPKIGPARPYVTFGLGIIKAHAEITTGSLLDVSNTNFGWDFGGGLMIFVGDHFGIRGEIRRFRTFGDSGVLAVLPGGGEKLQFSRAAAGLVLAF